MRAVSTAAPAVLTESRGTARSLPFRIVSITAFVGLLALGAHAKVFMPGNPVPITMQTAFVLLAGALLGPADAVIAVLAYVAAGVAGAPLFTLGAGASGLAYLSGPTGGYLAGFVLAAALTGGAAMRLKNVYAQTAAFLLATFLILVCGVCHLHYGLGIPFGSAVKGGALVFVPGDIAKAVAALALYRWLWNPADEGFINGSSNAG